MRGESHSLGSHSDSTCIFWYVLIFSFDVTSCVILFHIHILTDAGESFGEFGGGIVLNGGEYHLETN